MRSVDPVPSSMPASRSGDSSTPGEAPVSPLAPAAAGAPATDGRRDWPGVSVVMPVLNEQAHLADAVRLVLDQEYPGELEVVLAVGPSRDRTEAIAAELAAADPRVRVVANPTGRTPAGLNAAIAASRHPVVVRVDGHGLLSAGYVRRAVELLEETGAANVGGTMDAQGVGDLQQAVARAMTSRLGIGGARFHVGGEPGPADTVYLGVFRRDVLEQLGGYDEHFHRAQDWELNYRIRRSGGLVWYSPDLSVTYRPRASWRALASQFFRTGQWRREVIRHYPDTLSPRYLAPPAAVVGVVGGLVAGALVSKVAFVLPAGYALLVAAGSVVEGRGLPPRARLAFPGVVVVMHGAWGAGFLAGGRPRRSSRKGPAGGADASLRTSSAG